MKTVILFSSLIHIIAGTKETSILETLSTSIGDEVLQCQEEMKFNDDVIMDLLDFWNNSHMMKSKDLGCALYCVFARMELVTNDGSQVKKNNVKAFTKAVGADENMSGKIVELFQLCRKAVSDIKEPCEAALQVSKCFRYGIFQLHWAPKSNPAKQQQSYKRIKEGKKWAPPSPSRRSRNSLLTRLVDIVSGSIGGHVNKKLG